MIKRRLITLVSSHLLIACTAFFLGIYSLPIIMAPTDPSSGALAIALKDTRYVATIADDLSGSDWLHWGQGRFSVGNQYIVFQGKLAPGPAYRLYLSPKFVETEKEFTQFKASMIEVGTINSFGNYIIPVSKNIKIGNFNTLIIWCESFNQFITAAQFKQ
jgi:hypothetical protein